MALEVGLVDDVQAVDVAQVEKPGVRRVMGGAHRVDVVLLHQDNVVLHRGQRDGPPMVGVELVAVDAAQRDRHTVEKEKPVPALDVAEAHPYGRHLDEGTVAALRATQTAS